jgi:FeS assembly SUF system protein
MNDPRTLDQPQAYDSSTDETSEPAPANALESRIIAALKSVYDPEIPVDIYELGLIYDLFIDEPKGDVEVSMTLTAPGCPVAGSMPGWVEEAVESVDGVNECRVQLVWEPPWTPERMSMRAKLELNMF